MTQTTTHANGSTSTARDAVRRRRARIAIGCCVAAIVAIIVLAVVLSENVVYFRTVSEAVRSRASTGDARFRIAGKVVPGTVHTTKAGVRFELTDGKATAAGAAHRRHAGAVQGRRPGGVRRALGRPDHDVRLGPDPHQARQRLHATEGEDEGGRQRVKAHLGVFALAVGASACLFGIGTLALGLRRHDARLLNLGRRYVYLVLLAAVLAVGAMEWALLTHDFSLKYVAENNARGTPLLFTITGLWAALEGSILLWVLVLGGYLTFMARRFRDRSSDPLVGWATLVGLCVALFFFALTLGPANPFKTLGVVPSDGRGPNALLQNHPLMAFHPPMLYLGYVGFTVPFAFAVAALITGRFGEGWLSDTRRATLVAWGFLTVGIILGAWWSYEVLGWGGYWAWDPVENASLLPWLTATAFIHSVIVQERRGMLRVWNLSLVIATFCLTILGTFLTRSGVLNSVHSFTESPIGPWLLSFLALVAAVGIGLIAWRGDRLRTPGRIDSPVSRESAFLLNNLLFAGLALVVLLGTVYPLLAEALQGRRVSVGEPYFDRMATPLGVALLFLMAAAPALPWRATTNDVLRRRLLIPAWAGGVTMIVALVLGAHGVTDVIAFGLRGLCAHRHRTPVLRRRECATSDCR